MVQLMKCPEGHTARTESYENIGQSVVCSVLHCWMGPIRPTDEEAGEQWNSVMQAVEDARWWANARENWMPLPELPKEIDV